MSSVLMYCTANCPFCLRAKNLLKRKGIAYTEIPVDHDPEQMQIMMQRSKRRTVPQIFIGDHHVGGYDDLAAADAGGELDELLANLAH
ncbi:glutaredoxin [Achromatium sp. WMS2]|nr:glutaredoxin [Achromatium sp. WMS2]